MEPWVVVILSVAVGLVALWLIFVLGRAAIVGALFLLAFAGEQGFIGLTVYVLLWVFFFPVMLVISIIFGFIMRGDGD